MRAIAQYVRDALAFRYADVRISVKKGLLAPRISWTDRRKPRRQVLRLKCSQAAALTLARRSPDDLRDLAVRLCARKCWRRTGDKRSDMWTVHVDARMKDTGAGP
jgi:hypothetical protein